MVYGLAAGGWRCRLPTYSSLTAMRSKVLRPQSGGVGPPPVPLEHPLPPGFGWKLDFAWRSIVPLTLKLPVRPAIRYGVAWPIWSAVTVTARALANLRL